jgi:hypothetical protein
MGPIERGVRTDLRKMPDDLRKGALAQTALMLSRQLDSSQEYMMQPRDLASFVAQLRHCMTQLREWAPGEARGDATDAARVKRENRLNTDLHAVPDMQ